WGANYQGVIEEQRLQAAAFAEAGYDLVVGHGPHVPQPAEVLGSTPVFYSLGNFVFGAPGRFSPSDPPYGLVLTTEYTASGLTGITVECLEVDNRRVTYQPRPCDLEEAAAVLDRLGVTAVTRRIEGSRGATPRAHRDSRKPAS
ncbi:MAG: CapA family protein, partial [Coriobacteriia bacterium]|nr:CapA family protein [Coriobacteriia bacterium]